MLNKVFCENCGTEINREINFKIYQYIHPETERFWCDICASREEIDINISKYYEKDSDDKENITSNMGEYV